MDFWNIENSEYWFCSHQFIFPRAGLAFSYSGSPFSRYMA
jgi:hypothetical protein